MKFIIKKKKFFFSLINTYLGHIFYLFNIKIVFFTVYGDGG